MEPSKLEKQFKEQLNSREIKPSEMAWAKLDAMLSDAEKPKARFPWLYVAASFAGLLLIGTAYFTSQKNTIEDIKNKVVIQKSVIPQVIMKPILNTKITVSKSLTAGIIKKPVSKRNKEELVFINNQVEKASTIDQYKENDVVVVSFESKNYESTTINKYVSAEKLLADVSNAKFEPKATDKIIEKTKKSILVDPKNLLTNAETELNQSYRESALDRVNKKFKEIKTAFVNRNYEE